MPEVVENWVSQLLGEILLAMIFAVGLPLLWRLSNALKDLKVSIDALKDTMNRVSLSVEKMRDDVADIEGDLKAIKAEHTRQDEKLESGFSRMRDLLMRMNGKTH